MSCTASSELSCMPGSGPGRSIKAQYLKKCNYYGHNKGKSRSHWASLSCWNTVNRKIVKSIFVASCCYCRVLVCHKSYPNSLSHLPACIDASLWNQRISTRHLFLGTPLTVNEFQLTGTGAYTRYSPDKYLQKHLYGPDPTWRDKEGSFWKKSFEPCFEEQYVHHPSLLWRYISHVPVVLNEILRRPCCVSVCTKPASLLHIFYRVSLLSNT